MSRSAFGEPLKHSLGIEGKQHVLGVDEVQGHGRVVVGCALDQWRSAVSEGREINLSRRQGSRGCGRGVLRRLAGCKGSTDEREKKDGDEAVLRFAGWTPALSMSGPHRRTAENHPITPGEASIAGDALPCTCCGAATENKPEKKKRAFAGQSALRALSSLVGVKAYLSWRNGTSERKLAAS